MLRTIHLFVLALLLMGARSPALRAQGSAEAFVRQADQHFQRMAYAQAAVDYRKAAELGAVNEHVTRRLGDCYMKLRDTHEAEHWYAIAVKFLGREPRDMFNYAQALKGNAKYELAEEWMDRYLATLPPEGGARRSNIISFARKFNDQPDRFTVKKLDVNSPFADFGPSWCGSDQVLFASARNMKVGVRRTAAWNDQPFLDLYVADVTAEGGLTRVRSLPGSVNSSLHEGPATCSTDGATLYFTRNIPVKLKVAGGAGISRLGIFRARRSGSDYTGVDPFLYNTTEFSMAHPALSPDGRALYFVSDMPGGYGGTDIYVCRDMGGHWGEPENLGPAINTPYNEATPYVAADGTLYFASDGHPGLGGFDIFASPPTSGGHTVAINVGAPVNGPKDELSFIIDAQGKRGFFSSNRPGGEGDDDLYGFVMHQPLEQRFLCIGVVIDDEIGEPVIGVDVTLQDMTGQVVATTTTDAKGEYVFGVEKDKEYRVVARMKGRFDGEQHLSTERIEATQIVARDIHLVPDAGVWMRGAVRYKDRLGFIPGMTVSVVNLSSFNTESTVTGDGGDFSFRLQPNEEFEVLFEKEGYYSMSVPISSMGMRRGVIELNQVRELSFEPIELGKPIRLRYVRWSDIRSTTLEPAAKAELDQLAERLKVNPALLVEVGVHHDAQGDPDAARKLTQQRAKAIVDHLISKGVPKDRLTGQGHGADRVLNQCVKGVTCTEAEHAENRRVEYTVTGVKR